MTDLRQAAQQALECIERLNMRGFILADFEDEVYAAISALKAALEQPEQEPVVWTTMPEAADWDFVSGSKDPTGKLEGEWFPLYTTPPAAQRQWVGLTDEEIFDVIRSLCADNETAEMLIHVSMDEYRAIEAKLKEKNT